MTKTRKEAIRLGMATYYTGKPCGRGHLSERRTTSGICIQCNKEAREAEQDAYKKARAEREKSGVE